MPMASDHPDRVARCVVEQALNGNDNLCMVMLGAAMARAVRVFAMRRDQNHAYEIHPDLWGKGLSDIANPATMARTGTFALVGSLLGNHQDAELSGADLYVEQTGFHKLARSKGASELAMEREAQKIVSAFQKKYPGERMVKPEMLEQMKRIFLGAGKSALERTIDKVWPTDWRKPGRRRGH